MPRVAHLGHNSSPSGTLRASWTGLFSYLWLTCAPTGATSAPAEGLVVLTSAGGAPTKYPLFTLSRQDALTGRVVYQPEQDAEISSSADALVEV
jgi:hypothetical protein